MAESAIVYIMEAPYHADKPYEYYIPGMLRDDVQPGVLVEVPFGGGNRKMTAVVYSLTESPTDSDVTLKPIQGALSDGAILSGEMLELCRFLKEYTLCTYGDAVRTAVPASAMTKISTCYVVTERVLGNERACIEESERLGDKDGAIFRFLAEKRRASRQRILRAFAFECSGSLQRLEKAGLVRREYLSKGTTLPRQRDVVRAVAGDIPVRLRSANHRKVLEYLRENGSADYDELAEKCGIERAAARSAAQSLKQKGLVRIFAEEVYRNRFTPERYDAARNLAVREKTLSEEQRAAYEKIVALYETGVPKAALLHGVTGSGKTNVIMAAIDRTLADGRGVIMLIPEIALTPQTVGLFLQRYGERIAVVHSGLSAGERFDAWRRIREGVADVVVGTRSAVFAPLEKIGMIIIDEEHESAYKSDASPRYHAHDVARFRCREHNAMMLLASATPSVESYYKAKTGTYALVELKNRYGGARLPEVVICDMRGSTELIGNVLAERLAEGKKQGNQAILFLNRRGYNNYLSCRVCGKGIRCPHCSVTMTYHLYRNVGRGIEFTDEERRENGYLLCHMCGYRTKVPEKCPECGGERLLFMGCGTQKAEDDLLKSFQDFRVLRMDRDATQSKFSHEELLAKFRAGEADVLLGTQMVTKGHDFPKVSTVGVLNADSALFLDDYRAAERTFAMLTQVIGRAGRGDTPGCAVIQTCNPDNEVLAMAARQDYVAFYNGEIRLRRAMCFPPFCDIAVITLTSPEEGRLAQAAARMKERIMEHINEDYGDVPLVVYGPFEATVYRVQNVYRMRFVVKCRLNRRTRALFSELLCEFVRFSTDRKTGKSSRLSVFVDLNPTTV